MAVLLLAGMLSGCQLTKSAFANEVDNVSANFAAAATTLQYLHEGKLTPQFAKAAFFNYAALNQDAETSLKSASGTPDARSLDRLLRLYRPAAQAIAHPCLDTSCDW